MKALRTPVTAAKPAFSITHNDRLLSIGSCFSENIGKKFSDYKFSIHINPFGQQYNPYSVAQALQRLITPRPYTAHDLVYHDELYHSFDHHGSYSGKTADETLYTINQHLQQAANDLRQTSVMFLTFGTAHVFSLKENGQVVSNCHKLSGSMFNRRLLAPDEIANVLSHSLQSVWQLNPYLRVVLTVSPVRYFAFGVHENTVSKAHLFTALHMLQEQYPQLYYFPAYEIVMDDLRDYRFFAEDMLHPNYLATHYVWDVLKETFFDKATLGIMDEIDEVLNAVRHRPRNPHSEAHRRFVLKYLEKIKLLNKKLTIDFSIEQRILEQQLGA